MTVYSSTVIAEAENILVSSFAVFSVLLSVQVENSFSLTPPTFCHGHRMCVFRHYIFYCLYFLHFKHCNSISVAILSASQLFVLWCCHLYCFIHFLAEREKKSFWQSHFHAGKKHSFFWDGALALKVHYSAGFFPPKIELHRQIPKFAVETHFCNHIFSFCRPKSKDESNFRFFKSKSIESVLLLLIRIFFHRLLFSSSQ